MNSDGREYATWLEANGFTLSQQNDDAAWNFVQKLWQAIGRPASEIPSDSSSRARWSQSWNALYALCDSVPLWRESSSPIGDAPELLDFMPRLERNGGRFWLWDIGYRTPVVYEASFVDLARIAETLRASSSDVAVCSAHLDAVLVIPHWNSVHLWIAGLRETADED